MTKVMESLPVAQKIGVSPRQLAVVSTGVAFGAVSLLFSLMDWQFGRDAGIVGLLVTVLLALTMMLRSISLKAVSIRRDIMRQGQRQNAASIRIESNTGLSNSAGAFSEAGPMPTIGNSLGHRGAYYGIGAEYEYAWRAAQNLPSFETFALRTKSFAMRDVFARVATGLQYNYRDLLSIVRAGRAVPLGNLGNVVKQWRPKALLTLARVVANQRIFPSDPATSILLFELSLKVFGASALGKTDRRLYLEALVGEGRAREAQEKIKEFGLSGKDPVQVAFLNANLIRPSEGYVETVDWTDWLHKVNSVFATEEVSPISIPTGASKPLDRIASVAPNSRTDVPMVSIIVPTHDGSELIQTALRSLRAQTWKNIEIIVVDDCSSTLHLERLREICGAYENVTLLEQKINSGAYVARNLALKHVRGELITVHDDDDWSHPEKIERQASALLSKPSALANMSMHSRVTDELEFVRINNNPGFAQPNYSSIMFRRSDLERIGHWDTVNRGADAEFRDRIQNVFGSSVEVIGKVPMSFTRTRIGSLTHGEMDRGYVEPARLIYLDSYTQAHKLGLTGGKSDDRMFAAPLDMLPHWRGKHKGKFDVVFATDFRFPGGSSSLTIGEIVEASKMGLRVGVLQLDSPLNKAGSPFSSTLLEILLQESVALLRVRDEYEASLLVIRHPSVAQFLDGVVSQADIEKCILVANTAPVLAGGAGVVYDLEHCVANLSKCFDVDATIVPESGVTRKIVQEVAGDVVIEAFDWPGFIDIGPAVERHVEARTPIVGRHSRDHRLKWPDSLNDFLAAYYQPGVFSTHILGGLDTIAPSIPDEAKNAVRVTPFGGAVVGEYLYEVDFWVYYHSGRTIESFGMAAAEAMAAGLVVILPAYMKSTFGNGAVYAKPHEVASVVARFWGDSSLYHEQSRKARTYVQEHYSAPVYASRLRSLIAG